MKRLMIMAVVFLCPAFTAYAQDVDNMPVITVTGSAEVQIAPDEVVFSLGVTKTNKDLQIAKRSNDESVAKILELTRRFSVLPQNVQTTHISVDMIYESIRDARTRVFDDDGDEIGRRVFRGYEVSKTVIVRLTDISRFEEFFTEVLKTGVSEIASVTFETSKLRENRDRAREMAMKAAKEKATAMATALGQTIGKALRIMEGNIGSQPFTNFRANANTTETAGNITESLVTFAPGTIKVEARVTVCFQLN